MQPKENSIDKTRVFVVHGRNEELRKSMFDFLRSIGLKPIEWTQAIQMTGNASPFIGDILDAAFKQAQAVVVLLNGDDEARLREEYHSDKMPDHEKNLTPQARPNVIFEAGLALGRFPKRTIIVEVGDLRPFSDIAGRHTIRMNNSTKTRQDLAQRLSLAGCNVDLSGTDWHQSGNFNMFPRLTNQSNMTKPTKSEGNFVPPPKNVTRNILDEVQLELLRILAKFPRNSNGPTIFEMKKNLTIHPERFRFLIEKFHKMKIVSVKYPEELGGDKYENINNVKLTDDGWNFLLENDII